MNEDDDKSQTLSYLGLVISSCILRLCSIAWCPHYASGKVQQPLSVQRWSTLPPCKLLSESVADTCQHIWQCWYNLLHHISYAFSCCYCCLKVVVVVPPLVRVVVAACVSHSTLLRVRCTFCIVDGYTHECIAWNHA